MNEKQRKTWFKAKNYGFGWYPSSWQGWLATLAYLGTVLGIAFRFISAPANDNRWILVFLLPLLAATGLLMLIARMTGEKPQWRWGRNPKD